MEPTESTITPIAPILLRTIGVVITLYMMAVLLRWMSPYLEIDTYHRPMRLVTAMTEPPLQFFRRVLPPMGPMDWSPIATLATLWLVRILLAGY